jgi:hypothetical protein
MVCGITGLCVFFEVFLRVAVCVCVICMSMYGVCNSGMMCVPVPVSCVLL